MPVYKVGIDISVCGERILEQIEVEAENEEKARLKIISMGKNAIFDKGESQKSGAR